MKTASNPKQNLLHVTALISALGLMLSSCTLAVDDQLARKTLMQAGFKDITLNGSTFFDCGQDYFSMKFQATNPIGIHTYGAVCCGWFKSCTVRF